LDAVGARNKEEHDDSKMHVVAGFMWISEVLVLVPSADFSA
jgi:hypothetical protein